MCLPILHLILIIYTAIKDKYKMVNRGFPRCSIKDTFVFCACIINQSRLDWSLIFHTHVCSRIQTIQKRKSLIVLRGG